jgi:hypothetical protein
MFLRLGDDRAIIDDGTSADAARAVIDGDGRIDEIGARIGVADAQLGELAGTAADRILMTIGASPRKNAPVPTGSTGVIEILFVLSNGGRHVHEVVSEFTPPGSTTGPEPTQTSADDWKVASDKND